MKSKLGIFLLTIILLIPNIVYTTPLDFSGGVHNEYIYEEVVFITGEPIKFSGSYRVTETTRKGGKTINYRFSLNPEDKTIEGKLDRNITFYTELTDYGDRFQRIEQTEISGSYNETIRLDGNTYTLENYQFSKSDIVDNMPASDFYSGNIKARKYYTINRTEGDILIDITGGNVGYENFWGSTETLILDLIITSKHYERETEDKDRKFWQGTVKIQVSDSLTKTLKYSENTVNLSSYSGGYARVTNCATVSNYEYDLPGGKGTISLNQSMLPKLEMLIIPKFKDVYGHWGEDAICKLYSLDVFEDNSEIFSPDSAISRGEFTKAIIRACDIRSSITEEGTRKDKQKEKGEVSPFEDVPVDDSDYKYIKEALNKGVVNGVSNNLFAPLEPLTRAQAITILIRALGFMSKAPNPGYETTFSDDKLIPDWARDSIYVAQEIGLILGDTYNRVNPNNVLTRAEASTMIIRFLEFLEKDLQRDYRENIMNF